MKKVSELTGAELDSWVAKAQGWKFCKDGDYWESEEFILYAEKYHPSTDKAQAMDLLINFSIDVYTHTEEHTDTEYWGAQFSGRYSQHSCETPMIAICRAVVASKYGEGVEDEAKEPVSP